MTRIFLSIPTMLLYLDIASVEQLSSHVDIISYHFLPSRHRPGIDDPLPLPRYQDGYDVQISGLSFLSLNTNSNL